MPKRTEKENKNIYRASREAAGHTRESAAEAMGFVSEDRIEKVEMGRLAPRPEEVVAMSDCYRDPELHTWYCSHECPIGKKYVPEVRLQELSQITLEMLASLNAMDKEKNRLIEITVDGRITEDEQKDFGVIREKLNDIAQSVHSLQLWLEKASMQEESEE